LEKSENDQTKVSEASHSQDKLNKEVIVNNEEKSENFKNPESFEDMLDLLLKNKDSITLGKPYIKDAKIELEVVSHKRDRKILVYKMRPKKKTRRKMGHRQELTRVMVKSISIGKGAPKSSSKKETVKKETKPKSEKSTN